MFAVMVLLIAFGPLYHWSIWGSGGKGTGAERRLESASYARTLHGHKMSDRSGKSGVHRWVPRWSEESISGMLAKFLLQSW